MSYSFTKIALQKLAPGRIVLSNGDIVFRKLYAVIDIPPIVIPGLEPDNFDLSIIGLKRGTYTITVTTAAPSLRLTESEQSISLKYKVE